MTAQDWTRSVASLWKTVVFVGRYGAQAIQDVQQWAPSKVYRVAKAISEYLDEEARKAAMPSSSSRGGTGA